jgi:tetratricopeptide (TPR) repeat protein
MRVALRCAVLAALSLHCCFAQDAAAPDVPGLLKTGDAAFLRGDYDAARQAFSQAWELLQQAPAENPARYDVLKRLTTVRAAAGEFADADNYLQMATRWLEANASPDDPRVADDLLASFGLCRGLKQYGRALAALRGAMDRHLGAAGANSAALADDYSRMAQLYLDQGQAGGAVVALETALEIRSKAAGPLDRSLVPDLDRLAGLQTTLRDYEASETSFRHALAIRETLYGREDPDLIATLDGLAYACFGQQKFDVAEALYQRLLAQWIKSVGEEHPMTAVALDKIAGFYVAQKKYEQALAARGRANTIRSRLLAAGLIEQAATNF